jgi:hypothetical protein
MKAVYIAVFFAFCSQLGLAQLESFLTLQNTIHSTDSVIALNQSFAIDIEFEKALDSLNHLHPSAYFGAVNGYVLLNQWNQASFTYLLGCARYKYYNATYKKYQASGDGALFGSLSYAVGEIVNLYLHADIDQYIVLLEQVDSYMLTHDYDFHPSKKYRESYEKSFYTSFITDLKARKEQRAAEFQADRDALKHGIQMVIEQYNNLSEEEKLELQKR